MKKVNIGLDIGVTDGWFSCPTLEIQTNGDANWTSVSDYDGYVIGNSFNFGDKVSFIERGKHA